MMSAKLEKGSKADFTQRFNKGMSKGMDASPGDGYDDSSDTATPSAEAIKDKIAACIAELQKCTAMLEAMSGKAAPEEMNEEEME